MDASPLVLVRSCDAGPIQYLVIIGSHAGDVVCVDVMSGEEVRYIGRAL